MKVTTPTNKSAVKMMHKGVSTGTGKKSMGRLKKERENKGNPGLKSLAWAHRFLERKPGLSSWIVSLTPVSEITNW